MKHILFNLTFILFLSSNLLANNEIKQVDFSSKEKKYLLDKRFVNICIDPEFMPFEKLLDGKHYGLIGDYFKIIEEKTKLSFHIIKTKDWKETFLYAKSRKCDIISLAVKTPSRLKYFNFSKPYLESSLVLLTKFDKEFTSDIYTFKEEKIAVVKGHAGAEIIRNKYPNINLVELNSLEEVIKYLEEDKIYGFVSSDVLVKYLIKENPSSNLKISAQFDLIFAASIAVRNDDLILLGILNKAILSLNKEDKKGIFTKWLSYDVKKTIYLFYFYESLAFFILIFSFLFYRHFSLKKKNKLLAKNQEKLKDSLEEFENMINSTIEAIFVLDKGYCTNANDVGVKLFGYKNKEELIGLHALAVINKDFHSLVKENMKNNYIKPYECEAVKKDGTIFPVLVKGHTFIFKNKQIRITAVIDLSEIKSKDKQLAQKNKMVALGEMLGNISHQWKQPLSVISTAASGVLLQKDLNILEDKLFYEAMNSIVKNTKYLSKTITVFTDFIKDDKKKKLFSIKDNINNTLCVLTAMLKINNIKIIMDFKDDFFINNYENEFSEALMNILNNAKDAFISNNIEERLIFINVYKDKDIIIEIKDNANGIKEELLEKIFEPYFTTKHKSQGTGLGLYIVSQIIEDSMKGAILVTNNSYTYNDISYKGALFRLSF